MRNDFYFLIALYVVPSIIFLWKAYKASKSGSIKKVPTGYPGGYKWVEDPTVNVPMLKTGWFKFWLAFTAGFIVIFTLIAVDFWDVWFE
jgi:hypothetical protein